MDTLHVDATNSPLKQSEAGLYGLQSGLSSGTEAVLLVMGFGVFFLLLEFAITHSPISRVFYRMLKSNPTVSDAEAKKCVPMVVTRVVGFIHNAVQVPIAVWCICHPLLRADRLYAAVPLGSYMLCIAGGFFLHDAVSCLLRESPFYVIHGLTCCLGYMSAAAYGVAHFYGGLFLMWEVSTPFVQLRWVLYKMGFSETALYKINGLLMVVAFGTARIFFGTYFVYLLLTDTVAELKSPRENGGVPSALWIGFSAAALTVSTLNYYWFALMMRTLLRIFFKGHTWTHASHGKNE